MTAINTVIVDKQTLFREGIKSFFKQLETPNIRIIGDLETGEDLLLFLRKHLESELLFLDLNLPDLDGLELIPQLRKEFKSLKICVLTSYGDYKFVGQALKNGADGYILKSNDAEDLIESIYELMSGKTYIAPGLHITPPNGRRLKQSSKTSLYEDRFVIKQKLTKREQEVLTLIAQAKNNKEIARELYISDQTVGVHRKNIMRKLGVRNTINLIKFALENQLV